MPKTIKEVLTDYSGVTSIEYSDGSTRSYTVDNVATISADGQSLVGAGGVLLYLSDTPQTYQLPPATTRITASQAVVGKAVKLVSVKCISATAIALTIYDNGTTNAGTVLFTQTMSTGDEALIPTPIQAINGLYASFTGTATFDIGAQDAS